MKVVEKIGLFCDNGASALEKGDYQDALDNYDQAIPNVRKLTLGSDYLLAQIDVLRCVCQLGIEANRGYISIDTVKHLLSKVNQLPRRLPEAVLPLKLAHPTRLIGLLNKLKIPNIFIYAVKEMAVAMLHDKLEEYGTAIILYRSVRNNLQALLRDHGDPDVRSMLLRSERNLAASLFFSGQHDNGFEIMRHFQSEKVADSILLVGTRVLNRGNPTLCLALVAMGLSSMVGFGEDKLDKECRKYLRTINTELRTKYENVYGDGSLQKALHRNDVYLDYIGIVDRYVKSDSGDIRRDALVGRAYIYSKMRDFERAKGEFNKAMACCQYSESTQERRLADIKVYLDADIDKIVQSDKMATCCNAFFKNDLNLVNFFFYVYMTTSIYVLSDRTDFAIAFMYEVLDDLYRAQKNNVVLEFLSKLHHEISLVFARVDNQPLKGAHNELAVLFSLLKDDEADYAGTVQSQLGRTLDFIRKLETQDQRRLEPTVDWLQKEMKMDQGSETAPTRQVSLPSTRQAVP